LWDSSLPCIINIVKKTIRTALFVLAMGALLSPGSGSAKLAGTALPLSSGGQVNSPAVIRFVKNPTPVPAFSVRDLEGHFITSSEWRGKVVILNFWATWCGPCRLEITQLIALAKQYGDSLQVVGLLVDETSEDEVKKFAERAGINYPVAMATTELQNKFGGVAALPTSFVINREGGVVQKHVGAIPREYYETEIRALLALPVDARIETFEDTGQVFLANASRATELPGIDFSKLTAEQKRIALKKLNSQDCNCGCRLTLAQCRINDTGCPVSLKLAQQIVDASSANDAPKPTPEQKQP
jgi:thiol-disulfide isomerase/thioredoxin